MATLYVSNSTANGYALGVDSNNGLSKAAPKLTLEAAITASANGDTIIVNDGTYVAATYFANGKNTTIIPENAYGVMLRASSGSSVFHFNNSSGAQVLGKFIVDPTSASIANAITRGNPTGDIDWTLDGTRLIMGTSSAITDYSNRGVVNIDVEITGSGGSYGYLGSTSAAQLANKMLNIVGIKFGDFTVGSGAFVGMSATRYGASPSGLMVVDCAGVAGILRANDDHAASCVIGIQVTGASTVDVHDNDFYIFKGGDTSSYECIGIQVRSVTATSVVSDGKIRDNKVRVFAPTCSGILAGQQVVADYSTQILTYDNEVDCKYYPFATPHALYLGGLGANSTAYRNITRDAYVGIIQSICNGSMVYSNITDGCYGVDLYAKGCGASSAPIFANNTLIKRNRGGDMRSDLGAMAANPQGAVVNTDAYFVNNRVVDVDMTPRMTFVGAGQTATFERNGYPKSADLAADSFKWQGTSQDFATWKAAHEADAAQEFARITVTTDGKLSAGSRLCHSAKAVTGITDSGEEDPFGNEFPTYPNIGADQFNYDAGFSPWSTCDAPLPPSAQPCKDHALPIGVGKITVFDGIASDELIDDVGQID